MFSSYHCIWLAVCAIIGAAAVIWLKRRKPSLQSVLSFACMASILSELTKTFSVIQMVPSHDGTVMHPYLEMQHLPLHLCSIQILFIFFVRFAKTSKLRETLLAFMYPTCLAGAFLAMMMPSIYGSSIDVAQSFTHPLAYQYFLYHVMLVTLGIYIPMSREVDIQPRHYFTTLGLLGGLAFLSLYLNSMFAVPVYQNGVLKSVDYTSNFFFTYKPPIDIALTELWHWYVYFGIIVCLAAIVLALFYMPYIRKAKKRP